MSTPIYSITKSIVKNLYLACQKTVESILIQYESDHMTVSFKYGYSFDDVTYSEWFDTKESMISHINISGVTYSNIYVRVQLIAVKNDIEYGYVDIIAVNVNNVSVPVMSIETVQETNKILQKITNEHLYQPYRNLEDAQELNKKLAYAVAKIFGHKTTYFRTEPETDTQSMTFKSYRLSNVKEFKEVKINIVDNELPDNRTNFSEWDYDFFDQLECHIVVEEFEEVFGSDKIPNADDYLFLPLTNQMYQINTVNLVKKFMHKATYYQCVLTKWEDRADVNDKLSTGQVAIDVLPDNTLEYADEYGLEMIENEFNNAAKPYTTEEESNNVIIDAFKSESGMTIINYMFDYSDKLNSEIVQSYDFNAVNEFSVLMWFKSPQLNIQLFNVQNSNNQNSFICELTKFGKVNIQYKNQLIESNLTCSGSNVNIDTRYGLIFNYVYNEKGTYLTITIINEQFEIVQQNFTKEFDNIIDAVKINFNGQYVFGNLRVRKEIVQRSQISTILSDMLPSSEQYYVLRNATPSIKGEQYKVN